MTTHGRIIAVANQKGGVGKTTTAMNVATAIAATRKKTLLIDLDPQGNASTGTGARRQAHEGSMYEVLVDNLLIDDVVQPSEVPDLWIAPSDIDLSATEIDLIQHPEREYVLREALSQSHQRYDYIFIDCPPSLGILTLNALATADSVLIPLQCEFFALEGLTHLLKTLELVKENVNPELEIEGIVMTMYDRRNRLTVQVEEDVRDCLGDLVYKTIIPRNVRLSEAPSHGKPALIYDTRCSGSKAYILLAKEILEQHKIEQQQPSHERVLEPA